MVITGGLVNNTQNRETCFEAGLTVLDFRFRVFKSIAQFQRIRRRIRHSDFSSITPRIQGDKVKLSKFHCFCHCSLMTVLCHIFLVFASGQTALTDTNLSEIVSNVDLHFQLRSNLTNCAAFYCSNITAFINNINIFLC